MNSYIAVVFPSDDKAHQALRKLWHMDEEGLVTVHGAAVVRRDDRGHIRVANRISDLGMRTAIGVGVGALLGLLAGPVGVAAVVAEVSEDWTQVLDDAMRPMGGIIHRRMNNAAFGAKYNIGYLSPYYSEPSYA